MQGEDHLLGPNISGRAMRVRLAPLALGSLGALSLAAPTAGETTHLLLARPMPHTALRFARLRSQLYVLEGRASRVRGALVPARAGHMVELQRRTHHGWQTVAHSFTGARGRFRLRYTPHHLSREHLRVLFPGDGAASATTRRVGVLSVFRLAGASWYGGGGSLACGGWLTGSTLGVANKTLPCGTLVTLRYGPRSVRVPVIDRGPYVAGREFDLTEATKRALGFAGVGEVWSSR